MPNDSFHTHREGISPMVKGAATATIGGDRNCKTRASEIGSSDTDQNSADTETKLHRPLNSRKPRLKHRAILQLARSHLSVCKLSAAAAVHFHLLTAAHVHVKGSTCSVAYSRDSCKQW